MRSYLCILSGAAILLALASPAAAAGGCPEGKTAAGECINPGLARVMRKQVIVATQPKISYTAPIYLPSEGRFYSFGRDYHEMRVFFGNRPCGGTVIC